MIGHYVQLINRPRISVTDLMCCSVPTYLGTVSAYEDLSQNYQQTDFHKDIIHSSDVTIPHSLMGAFDKLAPAFPRLLLGIHCM